MTVFSVHHTTTYRYKNHTVRNAGWRYIRYENGDEELYDETKDPNEWTNLATKPEFAAKRCGSLAATSCMSCESSRSHATIDWERNEKLAAGAAARPQATDAITTASATAPA